MMQVASLVPLLFLLVVRPVAAVQASPRSCAAGESALREAVVDVHERQRNVGIAVAIAVDGELAFEEYRGNADLEHEVPVGPATRFGIASVTKLFTAVALLGVEADGGVSLADTVWEYVPPFASPASRPITLAMLASHTSGLPHPEERTPQLFATHYETATDAVELFREVELLSQPGAERNYSSTNYNLIAAAIEGATGSRFVDVVRDRILAHLALEATEFDDVLAILPDRARRYSFYHPWTYAESESLYRVPSWDYSFNVGGGNLISTARDLATFGTALIEPSAVLPAAQFAQLYDQSWFGRRTDAGERYLFISGANPGVQAGLAIYPERRTVAAVLSNTWGVGSRSGEMGGLARKLAELCAPAPHDSVLDHGAPAE